MNLMEATIKALQEKGYSSDTINYNFAKSNGKPIKADLSALRRYANYLENFFSDTEEAEGNSAMELESDEFSDALDVFINALVAEQSRIDKAIKEIENCLMGKSNDEPKKSKVKSEKPKEVVKEPKVQSTNSYDDSEDDLPF